MHKITVYHEKGPSVNTRPLSWSLVYNAAVQRDEWEFAPCHGFIVVQGEETLGTFAGTVQVGRFLTISNRQRSLAPVSYAMSVKARATIVIVSNLVWRNASLGIRN